MHLKSPAQQLLAKKRNLCVPFKSDAARLLKIFLKQYVTVAITKIQETQERTLSPPSVLCRRKQTDQWCLPSLLGFHSHKYIRVLTCDMPLFLLKTVKM